MHVCSMLNAVRREFRCTSQFSPFTMNQFCMHCFTNSFCFIGISKILLRAYVSANGKEREQNKKKKRFLVIVVPSYTLEAASVRPVPKKKTSRMKNRCRRTKGKRPKARINMHNVCAVSATPKTTSPAKVEHNYKKRLWNNL